MGSYGVDVEIRFNTASALKNAAEFNQKYKKLMEDATAGVEGAGKKAEQALASFSRSMVSNSTRAARQLESTIKTVERQAEMSGKAVSDQILVRWQKHIKAVGDDTEAVKRLNAAYQQLHKTQLEEERRKASGPGAGSLLFRGARDVFEGRMTYGVMDLGRAAYGSMGGGAGGAAAASGLTALPILAVAGTAALAGMAAAGYKAAESIGEVGAKIHDIQQITGMSAREVQQFGIAEQMAGHSADDLIRLMRYFTVAAAETTGASEKAREGMRKLGVDIVGLQTGSLTETQLLQQLSKGLRENGGVLEQNANLMDILKRSAFQSKGAILEFSDAVEKTKDVHLLGDNAVDRAKAVNDELILMKANIGGLIDEAELWMGSGFMKWLDISRLPYGIAKGLFAPRLQGGPQPGPDQHIPEYHARLEREYKATLAGMPDEESTQKELQKRKQAFDDAKANAKLFYNAPKEWMDAVTATRISYERQQRLVEDQRKAKAIRESEPDRAREATKQAAEAYAAAISKDQGIFGTYNKTMADIAARRTAQPSLTPEIRGAYLLEEAAALKRLNIDVKAGQRQFQETMLEGGGVMTAEETHRREEARKTHAEMVSEGLLGPGGILSGVTQAPVFPGYQSREQRLKRISDQERRSLGLFGPSATLAGMSPGQTAAAEYQMKIGFADAYLRQERENNKNLLDESKLNEEARQRAEGKRYDAAMEYEQKLAEIQVKLFEHIQSTAEGLAHTLFTDPRNFGGQLRTTVRDAALKPFEHMIGTGVAQLLTPILGRAGESLSSIRPWKGTMPVTVMNPGDVTAGTPTGGYNGGGGTFGIGGGGGGLGGTFGGGAFGGFGGLGHGGTAGLDLARATLGASLGGGGGDIYNLPSRNAGMDLARATLGASLGGGGTAQKSYMDSVMGFLGKYIGGSPFGKGGLGTVEGTFRGYSEALGGGAASAASRIKALSTGPFAKTPAGPAAAGVGMMLASAGIFGEQRGRTGGILEAGAGGFMAAGPIGAAVGFGIGIGEMAAGVEAPRYEAIRLIRQIYHVTVNNTTADQVVAIAQQSYGGRVSVAVRSPEVRHMIGLYAAGTGQNSLYQQSLGEAHGASLVESGGVLSQQSTYQYGNPYTYRSSLPVYGGGPSQTLGAPGGMSLSLNIGGQDAARFMQGNVVTPDVVQTQYASAMFGSNGRVPQALMMSEPGSIVS